MKRPSFQFYPQDWLSDSKLQLCEIEEEGLLIRLICHMHQGTKYGSLDTNDPKFVQKLTKISPKKFYKSFQKLLKLGIILTDENGYFFCKRMVEDERLRKENTENGKKGGNPKLLTPPLTPQVNPPHKASSSSSSSLSSSEEKELKKKALQPSPKPTRLPAGWAPSQTLTEWAKKERPDLDLPRTIEHFTDYWTNIFGQKGLKLNWDLTFKNWIRNETHKNNGIKPTLIPGNRIIPASERKGGLLEWQ